MTRPDSDKLFAGSIPRLYEEYLVGDLADAERVLVGEALRAEEVEEHRPRLRMPARAHLDLDAAVDIPPFEADALHALLPQSPLVQKGEAHVAVKGTLQILNPAVADSAALAGISGLGHITLSAAFVLLLLSLGTQIKARSGAHNRVLAQQGAPA